MVQDLIQDLAQDLIQDLAQVMVQDLAQDLAQDLVQDLAQYLAQDLVQYLVQDLVQDQVQDIFLRKIMELDLKWVHMVRYGLILRLDGAIWLRIISETSLTPRRTIKIQNQQFFSPGEDSTQSGLSVCSSLLKRIHRWRTREDATAVGAK